STARRSVGAAVAAGCSAGSGWADAAGFLGIFAPSDLSVFVHHDTARRVHATVPAAQSFDTMTHVSTPAPHDESTWVEPWSVDEGEAHARALLNEAFGVRAHGVWSAP